MVVEMPRCGMDQDVHMQQVYYYLKYKQYHEDTTTQQKNGIRKLGNCFEIDGKISVCLAMNILSYFVVTLSFLC